MYRLKLPTVTLSTGEGDRFARHIIPEICHQKRYYLGAFFSLSLPLQGDVLGQVGSVPERSAHPASTHAQYALEFPDSIIQRQRLSVRHPENPARTVVCKQFCRSITDFRS